MCVAQWIRKTCCSPHELYIDRLVGGANGDKNSKASKPSRARNKYNDYRKGERPDEKLRLSEFLGGIWQIIQRSSVGVCNTTNL
jgi:hypothetical protein